MSGLRIGCFACVDSILTIVLVKIYTFYCSMFTFFLLRPYKTIGFVYFSCFSVPVLAVFVVVIACTCLSVCVFQCVFAALLLVDRFVLFLYWYIMEEFELPWAIISFISLLVLCMWLLLLCVYLCVCLFLSAQVWKQLIPPNYSSLDVNRKRSIRFWFVLLSCGCWN